MFYINCVKPFFKAADGLHGDAAQERHGGEEAEQVRDAPHLGRPRRRHAQRQLPRGGPVRHGHLHQGGQRRRGDQQQREAFVDTLLQILDKFIKEEPTLNPRVTEHHYSSHVICN